MRHTLLLGFLLTKFMSIPPRLVHSTFAQTGSCAAAIVPVPAMAAAATTAVCLTGGVVDLDLCWVIRHGVILPF